MFITFVLLFSIFYLFTFLFLFNFMPFSFEEFYISIYTNVTTFLIGYPSFTLEFKITSNSFFLIFKTLWICGVQKLCNFFF